jgi:type II restriction/modification system DNA methylase subunit YeeA
VLDPACGSGHILVVAYDVLKAIYLERGYQARAIPRLILEKNLYGLDIDDRAAQMAGFALLMKARADDRRLFNEPPKLNVLSLQESKGLDAAALAQAISAGGTERVDVAQLRWLIDTFEHAKTFGSLIKIGLQPLSNLRKLLSIVQQAMQTGDLYAQAAAQDVLPLVQQALVLGMQFDAVVANPPYMGGKGMNPALKDYAKATFPDSKSDLFAMFMERGFSWCKSTGFNSMVTMQSWMFLSSYTAMREKLLTERTIQTMAHLGARAFSEISGEIVQTTAFVLHGKHFSGYKPAFFRLIEGHEEQKMAELRSGQHRFDTTVQDEFKKIPSSPVAYWATHELRQSFIDNPALSDVSTVAVGLQTGDNNKYLRRWHEVSVERVSLTSSSRDAAKSSIKKWFPYNKGGEFRKWYGNQEFLVNWENDGFEIDKFKPNSVIRNPRLYFRRSISWSFISSSSFGVRTYPQGFIFDVAGSSIFPNREEDYLEITGFLCSAVAPMLMKVMNPTLNFQVGNVEQLPFKRVGCAEISKKCIVISKADWDEAETSWDFSCMDWIKAGTSLHADWSDRLTNNSESLLQTKFLETENNRIFIEAYGLQDELTPEVPESQITLARADREKDCQRLISYAIGCMMGRYSLDEPGLIYAHAGNVGFDASRYASFPADADGIVPLTDELWFTDDAASRVREFLLAVWGADTLEENMAWLAESLGKKSTGGAIETPDETIRRYLADKFFKDHLQTYKKRPIYWLFSSGKQGAFQALVYLHRYTEGTLPRLRAEYVVPLTSKMQSRIDMLQKDALACWR